MKVGVRVWDTHEVLYDSTTDEVIFRDVKDNVVHNIPFMDIMRSRLKARPVMVSEMPPSSTKRTKRGA